MIIRKVAVGNSEEAFIEYGDRIEHPGRFKLNTFVA